MKDEYAFEVISGGMVLYERVGPVSEVAPYIKEAYKRVEDTCGVKFGEPYLKDLLGEGKTIMNSWPGCVAMTVFKSYFPDKAVLFAGDIQNAIYRDGVQPEDMAGLADLAVPYGIAKEEFLERMEDDVFQYATKQDFQMSQDMEATGYPTVLIRHEETYYMIARGYTTYEVLKQRVQEVVKS